MNPWAAASEKRYLIDFCLLCMLGWHVLTAAKNILPVTLVLALLLLSCGSVKDTRTAEKGVEQFHSQLDSEQYAAIYEAAGHGLRGATTEEDFVRLLQMIRQKLGRIQQSQLQNFQVGWSTGVGKTITLEYDTTFAGGAGTEDFVWHLDGNHPVLLGYHVTSNALIGK